MDTATRNAEVRRNPAVQEAYEPGSTFKAITFAAALGFETVVANQLETRDGRLTGRVLAPITGADGNREFLAWVGC